MRALGNCEYREDVDVTGQNVRDSKSKILTLKSLNPDLYPDNKKRKPLPGISKKALKIQGKYIKSPHNV